ALGAETAAAAPPVTRLTVATPPVVRPSTSEPPGEVNARNSVYVPGTVPGGTTSLLPPPSNRTVVAESPAGIRTFRNHRIGKADPAVTHSGRKLWPSKKSTRRPAGHALPGAAGSTTPKSTSTGISAPGLLTVTSTRKG